MKTIEGACSKNGKTRRIYGGIDVSIHKVNKNNKLTGKDSKIKNHPLPFYRGGNSNKNIVVEFEVIQGPCLNTILGEV